MSILNFDYGHGGRDSGAILGNRQESNDVLSIGQEIAVEMRRHGVVVDETRTNDSTVSLNARSSFENKNSIFSYDADSLARYFSNRRRNRQR